MCILTCLTRCEFVLGFSIKLKISNYTALKLYFHGITYIHSSHHIASWHIVLTNVHMLYLSGYYTLVLPVIISSYATYLEKILLKIPDEL